MKVIYECPECGNQAEDYPKRRKRCDNCGGYMIRGRGYMIKEASDKDV